MLFNIIKNSLAIALLFAASGVSLFAKPAASWNFDKGKNIDVETGTTEFVRSNKALDFTGLVSEAGDGTALKASINLDPARLFAAGQRGIAMRGGYEKEKNNTFAAGGILKKPLSRVQGAVTMWISPEDWQGDQKGDFRIFFAADDGNPVRSNELLIYKIGPVNNISFLIGNNNPKDWSNVQTSIWNWKPGEWHFVGVSWTADLLRLYVDGKLFEAPRKKLSDQDYKRITLGTRHWKNEGGLSLLDDVMIFDKPLLQADFDRIRQETKRLAEDRNAPASFNLTESTPVVDGKISPWEYGVSTNATFNIKTMVMSNSASWHFARDDKFLYFAADTSKPTRPCKVSKRDGSLWEDESLEFYVDHRDKKWHFIINSDGTFYDALQDDPAWNIRNLVQKHVIRDDRWICEIAIPLADLGISLQDKDSIYTAICRSSDRDGLFAAAPLVRRFADRHNFLRLTMDNSAPRISVDYTKFPTGTSDMGITYTLRGKAKAAVEYEASNLNGRKLVSKTVNFVADADNVKAVLNVQGVGKEGFINYTVTCNGNDIAAATLKYLSPEKLKVTYLTTDIAKQTLTAGITLTPPVSPDLIIRQQLQDKNGKEVLVRDEVIGKDRANRINTTASWDLTALPPGDYDYYVYAVENGKAVKVHHQYFMKPGAATPWQNFTGGISNAVPSPWMTPQTSGAKLQCLTQQYDFTGSLLPRQITANHENILSAPVQLRINGKIYTPSGTFRILRQGSNEVDFATTAAVAGYSFQLRGTMEYDGWCRMQLDWKSATGNTTEISDLALIFNLNARHSGLFCWFKPGDTGFPSGKLAATLHKDLMEHPVFWIGDADRGLFWGADSMRGTHLRNTAKSLTVTKNAKGEAAAVVNLVDSKFSFTGTRKFNFGIQATPTKFPRRDIDRPYMFQGGVHYTLTARFMKVFNSYQHRFIDLPVLKSMVTAAKKRGQDIYAFYSCIYGISPFTPEWPWYSSEWISSPPGVGQFKQDFPLNNEAARNAGMWAFACVNNPDFMNWQLYYLAEIIKDPEAGLKDMYFDMAYPRACSNPLHGCAWKDDFGNVRMTYPITANREFTKRIQKMLRDKNEDAVLMYHPSGEPLPPIYSLADVVVDGEIWVGKVAKDENYFNIFTPELFQAAYTGIKTGTHSIYLSQLNRAAYMLNPKRDEYWRRPVKEPAAVHAVRHFLGYLLLHNTHCQSGACIYNEGLLLQKQLYSLGWDQGNFTYFPYWRNECPVKGSAGSMVSAYAFPGRMLAVILNDSTAPVTEKITPPAGYCGRIYDMESGQEVNPAEIRVGNKNVRFIVFEEK